jgi:hypothetical protein
MATKNFSTLGIEDIELLARQTAAPCVSIFAPLRNGVFKTKEGPVRFSNQLKLARKYLENDFAMDRDGIERFLKPAVDLAGDHFFWKTPADGVAVFVAPKFFRKYRVPVKFADSITVGKFFDLQPLFPLLLGNEHYFLLILTKRQARLFHGTRYSINEIKTPGIPAGGDFFKTSDGDKRIESHGISASYKASIFHGHGGVKDAQHQILEQFCRAVSKEIKKLLMFETAPLLLSAPENMVPIYQKVNNYRNLVPMAHEITAHGVEEKEMARLAWRAVRPYFEKKVDNYLERYRELGGNGKTSADPRTIAGAAAEGRVEVLFCAKNARLWGKIDPLTGTVTINDKKTPGDEDLAARAAMETFLQKGLVYILSHDSLPQNSAMAAILRY